MERHLAKCTCTIEIWAIIGSSNSYVRPEIPFSRSSVVECLAGNLWTSVQGWVEPQLTNYKVKALPLSYKGKGKFSQKKKLYLILIRDKIVLLQ